VVIIKRRTGKNHRSVCAGKQHNVEHSLRCDGLPSSVYTSFDWRLSSSGDVFKIGMEVMSANID
jgi:hypothetical protein